MISLARARVSESLALLQRTREQLPRPINEDGARFDPPIVVVGWADPIDTVSDLIDYVQRSGHGTGLLRDELFIAAALPSAERARSIRVLAVANLRAGGAAAS